MSNTSFRFALTLALAAPLALAACADEAEEAGATMAGEPVAAVAAPEGTSWSQTASRTADGGWLVGNPDAPIRLLEYGSLTCPACAAFSVQGSEKLRTDYIDTGRVSYEFRSFMIHGAPDVLMSRLLECAAPAAAVPLADQIWANLEPIMSTFQQNQTQAQQAFALPPEQRFVSAAQVTGITDFFAARGMSADQSAMCLSDATAVEAFAESSQKVAADAGVQSTPTFFLNGNQIEERGWQEVEAVLQRAGARES